MSDISLNLVPVAGQTGEARRDVLARCAQSFLEAHKELLRGGCGALLTTSWADARVAIAALGIFKGPAPELGNSQKAPVDQQDLSLAARPTESVATAFAAFSSALLQMPCAAYTSYEDGHSSFRLCRYGAPVVEYRSERGRGYLRITSDFVAFDTLAIKMGSSDLEERRRAAATQLTPPAHLTEPAQIIAALVAREQGTLWGSVMERLPALYWKTVCHSFLLAYDGQIRVETS